MSFDVPSWLRALGLSAYAEAFAEHAIEADVLPSLTAHDLRDIGVTKVGDRRRLLTAIATLEAPPDADAAPSSPLAPPSEQPAEPALAGAERRQLSILVCDIVGSTELTTELDPEEMRDLIARFQR